MKNQGRGHWCLNLGPLLGRNSKLIDLKCKQVPLSLFSYHMLAWLQSGIQASGLNGRLSGLVTQYIYSGMSRKWDSRDKEH